MMIMKISKRRGGPWNVLVVLSIVAIGVTTGSSSDLASIPLLSISGLFKPTKGIQNEFLILEKDGAQRNESDVKDYREIYLVKASINIGGKGTTEAIDFKDIDPPRKKASEKRESKSTDGTNATHRPEFSMKESQLSKRSTNDDVNYYDWNSDGGSAWVFTQGKTKKSADDNSEDDDDDNDDEGSVSSGKDEDENSKWKVISLKNGGWRVIRRCKKRRSGNSGSKEGRSKRKKTKGGNGKDDKKRNGQMDKNRNKQKPTLYSSNYDAYNPDDDKGKKKKYGVWYVKDDEVDSENGDDEDDSGSDEDDENGSDTNGDDNDGDNGDAGSDDDDSNGDGSDKDDSNGNGSDEDDSTGDDDDSSGNDDEDNSGSDDDDDDNNGNGDEEDSNGNDEDGDGNEEWSDGDSNGDGGDDSSSWKTDGGVWGVQKDDDDGSAWQVVKSHNNGWVVGNSWNGGHSAWQLGKSADSDWKTTSPGATVEDGDYAWVVDDSHGEDSSGYGGSGWLVKVGNDNRDTSHWKQKGKNSTKTQNGKKGSRKNKGRNNGGRRKSTRRKNTKTNGSNKGNSSSTGNSDKKNGKSGKGRWTVIPIGHNGNLQWKTFTTNGGNSAGNSNTDEDKDRSKWKVVKSGSRGWRVVKNNDDDGANGGSSDDDDNDGDGSGTPSRGKDGSKMDNSEWLIIKGTRSNTWKVLRIPKLDSSKSLSGWVVKKNKLSKRNGEFSRRNGEINVESGEKEINSEELQHRNDSNKGTDLNVASRSTGQNRTQFSKLLRVSISGGSNQKYGNTETRDLGEWYPSAGVPRRDNESVRSGPAKKSDDGNP